jgi:hypothetical protein
MWRPHCKRLFRLVGLCASTMGAVPIVRNVAASVAGAASEPFLRPSLSRLRRSNPQLDRQPEALGAGTALRLSHCVRYSD